MHTTLPMPEPWTSRREGSLRIWSLPGTGITLEVDPMIPMPDDRKEWGEKVLSRDLPAGGRLEQTHIVNSAGKIGWPVTIVTTTIRDAAGKGVEARVSFFYEFLYFGAAIACRIPVADVPRYESELRPQILELMQRAEPHLRGPEVATIGELYDMAVTPDD